MTTPIRLIRVRGDHRSAGRQLGQVCAGTLGRAVDLEATRVPRGDLSFAEALAAAAEYRTATGRAFPWLLDELDGTAEGADVDPLLLFAASIEELWEHRPAPPGRTEGRCTDILIAPGATRSGHLLVAHNNDLLPGAGPDVVAVEWTLPGQPVIFSLGIGPWISVGWNSAGLSLTGNEVSPNDERCGIPRLLLVRAQLAATSLSEAAAAGLHPGRASAYNTVLADRYGAALNVEASATDSQCWGPDENGLIIHTNHYVSPRMRQYEGDPAYACRSASRLDRVSFLVGSLPSAGIDESDLRSVLADHDGEPEQICRHAVRGDWLQTAFWCIADVTAGRIRYGRGNPCQSPTQEYTFAPPG